MKDDPAEQTGYEIYRQFIHHGVGSCIILTVRGMRIPETPEEAVMRRWRQLPETIRERFIAEGREALEEKEDVL